MDKSITDMLYITDPSEKEYQACLGLLLKTTQKTDVLDPHGKVIGYRIDASMNAEEESFSQYPSVHFQDLIDCHFGFYGKVLDELFTTWVDMLKIPNFSTDKDAIVTGKEFLLTTIIALMSGQHPFSRHLPKVKEQGVTPCVSIQFGLQVITHKPVGQILMKMTASLHSTINNQYPSKTLALSIDEAFSTEQA